jgi:predicted DNA-binding transcriptional regulator
MALKGNLNDFSLTQLLNLISLANKTGTLVVEGQSDAARVFFRDGKLAYAQFGQEDNSLVGILHNTNRISAAQYRGIKEKAKGVSDKELGLMLINANYFSQQDIFSSLQNYFTGVLNRLFTWMEGFFHFETNLAPPDDRIMVKVSLENIILEGTRRLKEWEYLQDEIPSLEMALKFVDRPGTNLRNINLSKEEWRVISFVNPKNTMRQIAKALHLSDLEIRRIVFGLLQAGLIEIVRPAGGLQSMPGFVKLPVNPTPVNKEERKSLINRIISRIRSL